MRQHKEPVSKVKKTITTPKQIYLIKFFWIYLYLEKHCFIIYIDKHMKNEYLHWTMTELQIAIEDLERRLKILKAAQAELEKPTIANGNGRPIHIESDDVEKTILEIDGEFSAKEVPAAIDRKFPQKAYYNKSAIPVALYKLTAEKKLDYVRRRSGRKGAIYRVSK